MKCEMQYETYMKCSTLYETLHEMLDAIWNNMKISMLYETVWMLDAIRMGDMLHAKLDANNESDIFWIFFITEFENRNLKT